MGEKVHYLVPSGGDSVATAMHNTTLSALAVLRWLAADDSDLDLAIHYNIHAATPLTLEEYAHHGLRQYMFAAPHRVPDVAA
jgi:hypothetical protein